MFTILQWHVYDIASVITFSLPPGVLLLNIPLHLIGADGRVCQIRNHGHRRHHGGDDPGVAAAHGPHRQAHPAPLRPRRNVHLLHIHHNLFSHKGVSYGMLLVKNQFRLQNDESYYSEISLQKERRSFGLSIYLPSFYLLDFWWLIYFGYSTPVTYDEIHKFWIT